jgi:hypothetical protein
VLAVAALLLIVPAVQAQAGDHQQVSGAYLLELIPEVPLTMDQRSPNVCVITLGLRMHFVSGDLIGTADSVATMNNKGACDDFSAKATIQGKGSFDGALGDKQGAFDLSAVFWHDNFAAWGRLTIQHATGDLAGLHGVLHVEGIVGVGGDYHGKVHFAP